MDKKQFGTKLKSIIIESGLEAQAIADHLGCHYDAIMRWCRGESYPSPKYHKKLEKILNCRIIANFGIYRHNETIEAQEDSGMSEWKELYQAQKGILKRLEKRVAELENQSSPFQQRRNEKPGKLRRKL